MLKASYQQADTPHPENPPLLCRQEDARPGTPAPQAPRCLCPRACTGCSSMPGKARAASNVEVMGAQRHAMLIHIRSHGVF